MAVDNKIILQNEEKRKEKEKKFLRILNIFLLQYFNYIVFAIVIIVFIIGGLNLLWPKYRDISGPISLSIDQKKKNIEILEKNIKLLDDYKAEFESISEEDIRRLNVMLPKTYKTEKLFYQIEEWMSSNGYILNSININSNGSSASDHKGKTTANKIGKIVIDIDISGDFSYEKFKKLLSAFENSLWLIDIPQLSYEPGAQNMTFTLETYYLE